MKGLCKVALAMLFVAACGRDGAITAPEAPSAVPLAPGVLALGVDTTTGASIETNLDDYMPGEVVHLVGRGWAPGETVNLHMTENPDTHADVDTNVVADGAGEFSIHFYDVQTHDLGVTFTLTATGGTSGSVAVATFTDGQPDSFTITVAQSPNPATGPATPTYTIEIGYTGTSASCTATLSAATTASPAWPSPPPVGGFFSFSPSTVSGNGPGGGGGTPVNPTTILTVTVPAGMAADTYKFTVSATRAPITGDNCQGSGTTTSGEFDLVVAGSTPTNNPPTANANGDYSGLTNTDIALSGDGSTDTDGTITEYAWSYTVTNSPDGGTCTFTNASSALPNAATIECTQDGTYEVKLTVTDNDGATDDDVATLTILNQPPTADAGDPYSGVEGSATTLDGTGSTDSDGTITTYAWTYGVVTADAGASCTITNPSSANTASIECTDNGSYTVTLTVTDDDGATDDETVSLTVSNANPTISITSHVDGALFSLLNGPLSVTGAIGDDGANDTHSCRLELDGVLDETGLYSAATGLTCSPSVLPDEAGVYTLTIRVLDDDGGEGTASIMIVVYDPSAGFVTGGGWINSPAQAYKADLTLTGKANFGFVSKYKKGANVPEGNTEFQFHAGGMNFHSSTYQFLIVNQAGTNSQFKGTGTINGAGSYTFMIWATDGGNTGDKFRIQITDDNNANAIVYDNGVEQFITGSIVIHTGGKK